MSGFYREEKYEANRYKYGDGVYETSGGEYINSWYRDWGIFLDGTEVFFHRGGSWVSDLESGLFAFNSDDNSYTLSSSFRPVVVVY